MASLRASSWQNDTLEHLSHSDPLTGLRNRPAFGAKLRNTVQEASAQGGLVAVAMLDIDLFKRHNNHYRHQAGGTCLQRVAAAIKNASKRRDFVARLSGEEFAVIITSRNPRILALVGERIRHAAKQFDLWPLSTETFMPQDVPAEDAFAGIQLPGSNLSRPKTVANHDGMSFSGNATAKLYERGGPALFGRSLSSHAWPRRHQANRGST